MGVFIDLTGRVFGRLTVISRSANNKHNRARWLCSCECGKTKVANSTDLVNGHTQSCGCLAVESRQTKYGLAMINQVYSNYRKTANARQLEFEISIQQFIKITAKNCHYCGLPVSNIKINKCGNGDFSYNGMDRIDNTKGYTVDNVVPCCRQCNFAKRDQTVDEFNTWLKKLIKHQKETNW